MREFAVPPVAEVSDTATLTDPVWTNAEEAPEVAQFCRQVDGGWQNVTCAQFRREVVALAKGLLAAGIEPGDRVGLMSKTRYEWTLIDYAIWAAGAVTVPIYETSSSEQIAWILADSGAVGCFVENDQHRDLVTGARGDLPALEHLWQIEPRDGNQGAVAELVADGAGVPGEDIERSRKSRRADDLATIIYTSGTTGRPKGCALSHRNLLFDITNTMPGLRSLFHEGQTTLLFLPLAHSFARIIQVAVVQVRITMGHTPDIKKLTDDMLTFRPTFVLAVPRVFEKVYNAAKQKAHAEGKGAIFNRAERVAVDYSRALETPRGPGRLLRAEHVLFDRLVYRRIRAALGGQCHAAVSGSAPLGARLGHFFRGIGVTIYEGYGLTETSPACAVNLEHAIRVGTVGRPIPGTAVRIGDDGEILIKGDHVFQGYWQNAAATAEMFDPDGWFCTGDLGELDEDGFVKITGRKKELIVTAGGKNVAPAVLEDRLRAHPLISQCMVVGDRKPFVAALITIDEDAWAAWKRLHGKPAEATVADLREDADLRAEIQAGVDDANKAVSRAEAIKTFRILSRDFAEATGEMTPSMKVKRAIVLKQYADEIAAIYGG